MFRRAKLVLDDRQYVSQQNAPEEEFLLIKICLLYLVYVYVRVASLP